jgi:hypothetical protein
MRERLHVVSERTRSARHALPGANRRNRRRSAGIDGERQRSLSAPRDNLRCSSSNHDPDMRCWTSRRALAEELLLYAAVT